MTGWSDDDMGDLRGRTVVVTGANSGLGEQTVRALAAAGADVVLACRDLAKARVVADDIGPRARVASLDLADLAAIHSFAEAFDGADVLINNAGVFAVPLGRTVDGFEMQFGTNFLGHFALTGLILDKIADRVVTVSSLMHRTGRLDFADLNWERRRYRRYRAYGDSKLADLMFGLELARRLRAVDSPVRSVVAHPGYAATELQGRTDSPLDAVMNLGNMTPLAQSSAAGALPVLYAATSPDAVSGEFYGPKRFGGMRGSPAVSSRSRAADDQSLREQLWAVAERLTRQGFDVA